MDSTVDEGKYPESFESVPDASPDRIYFNNTERRLVHVGQTYGDIFDADPEELLGKQTEESRSDPADSVRADGERLLAVERARSQMDFGSGLDLWLAYWIIRRSGDDLRFEVTEGGTKVRIELPQTVNAGAIDGDEAIENRVGVREKPGLETHQ